MPRPAPPLTLPRGLIFMASLWLIGSWLLTIGVRTPIQPVSASYTPAVRMMLLCLVVGLMVGWPLLRLSQGASPHPVGQTVLDLVVLLALTQVVVWPLRLVTPWTVGRTAGIDATISAWVLVAGAIVTAAVAAARSGVRSLAMLLCLALCLLGPAIAAWSPQPATDGAGLVRIGPLLATHELTGGGGAPLTGDQWLHIAILGAASVVAWVMVGVLMALRRSDDEDVAWAA